MASCKYPRCRSNDIQLTYLGRPLCTKHWVQISEMTVEKARSLLNLPNTSKGKAPVPVEMGVGPTEERTAAVSPPVPPTTETDTAQMGIFGEPDFNRPEAEQDAARGQVHSLPVEKPPRRKAARKRKAKVAPAAETSAVQQSLFGELKEEAS